jgi:hypothetical protein
MALGNPFMSMDSNSEILAIINARSILLINEVWIESSSSTSTVKRAVVGFGQCFLLKNRLVVLANHAPNGIQLGHMALTSNSPCT